MSMEKAKIFTDRDFDFSCTVKSKMNSRIHGSTKDLVIRVWIEPDDFCGRKMFKFLCNKRQWGDDQPSEIRYDPRTDKVEMKHPGGNFRTMFKAQAKSFMEAYEREYVALQILMGEDNEEE